MTSAQDLEGRAQTSTKKAAGNEPECKSCSVPLTAKLWLTTRTKTFKHLSRPLCRASEEQKWEVLHSSEQEGQAARSTEYTGALIWPTKHSCNIHTKGFSYGSRNAWFFRVESLQKEQALPFHLCPLHTKSYCALTQKQSKWFAGIKF